LALFLCVPTLASLSSWAVRDINAHEHTHACTTVLCAVCEVVIRALFAAEDDSTSMNTLVFKLQIVAGENKSDPDGFTTGTSTHCTAALT